MKYTPDEETNLRKRYQEGKSAVRWAMLAMFFLITAAIAQLVWFFFLLTDNKNTVLAFIVTVGAFVLAEYCRWCANDSKPESWK